MRATALLLCTVAACAGRSPVTRYYDLAAVRGVGGGNAEIVLEPLTTDDAYDDERIVYRSSRFRLDYYDYHRWSASPGVMIGNFLELGLEQSGLFRSVTREATSDVALVLNGRVGVIEEVDVSRYAWEGHIVLELWLTDLRTGAAVWRERFEESEPLPRQSPEGLAEALSTALARIVSRAAPAISASLAEHPPALAAAAR